MMIQTTSESLPNAASGPGIGGRARGFTLMEVMFSMMVAILLGASIVQTLMFSQRFAARSRLYTNARAIVQRNIDAATGVSFTGATCTAATTILQITTGTSGAICDDDGGGGGTTPSENIQVLKSGSNKAITLVTGILTRFVSSEPVYVTNTTTSDPNALLMRITFRVDYNYLGKPYSYSETTLRSVDTQ